jgi:hypothetical protein
VREKLRKEGGGQIDRRVQEGDGPSVKTAWEIKLKREDL